MKKALLTLVIAVTCYFSYAQTNTFPSSGNVGIGTTGPGSPLDVAGSAGAFNATAHVIATIVQDHTSYKGIYLGFDGADQTGIVSSCSAGAPSNLAFLNYNGTSWFESMRLTSNGNVGIGTTTPGTALDVKGIIRATTGGLQIGKFGVASNPVLAIGIDHPYFSSSAIINGWNNSSNCGISIGTTRNDGVAFSVVTGATLDANYLPSTPGTTALTVLGNTYVGIGTTTPDAKLSVKGTIHTQEVKVDLQVPGPDYVFNDDYKLATLTEIKNYVTKNHHLPEIPSASQMAKDGINLGDMNTKLLKKVEELTLYLIEKDKQVNLLQDEVKQLKLQEARIASLEKALSKPIHKK